MSDEELSVAVDALQVTLEHSSDVSGLAKLLADGRLNPDDVIAVTGKTEGTEPGETSRLDADHAIRRFLAENGTRSERELEQIPMVFTARGVGILTPQVVVYTRYAAPPAPGNAPRLAVGTARSKVIQPEWTGTSRVVEVTADAVRDAAADAGIDPADTEYVVAKAYHYSQEELTAARTAGRPIPELTDHELFRKTSGSAGLGVAAAVEGVEIPDGDDIGVRLDLWSGRTSASANAMESVGEGPHTQLLLFGNRAGAGGRLRVGHAVVNDLLDVQALPRALRRAGMDVGDAPLTPEQRARVVAVYAKIGGPPASRLRGRRQIVENPNYSAEVKIAVAGMFSAYLQDNLIYISGSAIHQGPPGGGTIAVIVEAD